MVADAVSAAAAMIPDEKSFVTDRFLFPPLLGCALSSFFHSQLVHTKLWRSNSNYLNCFIRRENRGNRRIPTKANNWNNEFLEGRVPKNTIGPEFSLFPRCNQGKILRNCSVE